LRTDLKPLNIVQPEGTSFTVTEDNGTSTLEWQKWYMRVGFHHREGMVLHDVCTLFVGKEAELTEALDTV